MRSAQTAACACVLCLVAVGGLPDSKSLTHYEPEIDDHTQPLSLSLTHTQSVVKDALGDEGECGIVGGIDVIVALSLHQGPIAGTR